MAARCARPRHPIQLWQAPRLSDQGSKIKEAEGESQAAARTPDEENSRDARSPRAARRPAQASSPCDGHDRRAEGYRFRSTSCWADGPGGAAGLAPTRAVTLLEARAEGLLRALAATSSCRRRSPAKILRDSVQVDAGEGYGRSSAGTGRASRPPKVRGRACRSRQRRDYFRRRALPSRGRARRSRWSYRDPYSRSIRCLTIGGSCRLATVKRHSIRQAKCAAAGDRVWR